MRDGLLGFLKQVSSLTRGLKKFILQKLFIELSKTSDRPRLRYHTSSDIYLNLCSNGASD